ncbi:divalent-cation tolerance protein CutA [Bythopirellula polymerisocia]|uniref:Divalent-cation tolerance protein CutA n=1 Tax=Bythopirellula polymerisocia TaxID=2528003 RepID=A0A5C6D3C8_9BACT|nr:divalent-cation tolerance protein CutA [Bythopirellula polymerisocia]TWU29369.1 Divalent-cation tolerance protein CutA [Bythopirellula polymerisocia]
MTPFIQIDTTTSSQEEALQIARELVNRRLVACAHIIGPVNSIYHWKDQVEEGTEWHCLFKTRSSLFSNVAAAIQELHSYECPKIIALPIVEASQDYLTWLDSELKEAE